VARVVLIAVLAALALSGCSVTAEETTTYDAALIQNVGKGATAIASIEPAFTAGVDASQGFNNADNERATTKLLRGELSKLSDADLRRLRRTNRTGRRSLKVVLENLDGIADDLRTAQMNTSARSDLSDGSRRFIDAWNAYLQSNADKLQSVRDAFTAMQPTFGEFDKLLDAAYDTARLRSTAQFDKLNERFRGDLTRRVEGFDSVKPSSDGGSAERELVELVEGDQDAQAIVTEVNDRYPNGSLAQMFTRGGE